MSNKHHFSTVYPYYQEIIRITEKLPLSTRSLLIKLCQSQTFPSAHDSSLANLIDEHPTITIETTRHHFDTFTLRNLLNATNFNPYDPLDSAILLDIFRGVSTSLDEVEAARTTSWLKEIHLVQGSFRDVEYDWSSLLSDDQAARHNSIHPLLPPNPQVATHIYNSLASYRQRVIGRTFHSRRGLKNMSYSTRREYEQTFGMDLENVPIFHQKHWVNIYHETGIMLEGHVEMRQRWYTSGAKPRTYFAMGGTTYRHSRFLQDFFTGLVDCLPSTNHKTRLRPSRLSTPETVNDEPVHWRIYDLSSFTSNCCVQRSYCKALIDFFSGVEVFIVDEHSGPQVADLGDLLSDYYNHCVVEPLVSLERFDSGLDTPFEHEVASMLGIFGNLMTCTMAHASLLLPIVDSVDQYNCAGDDGLIPERLSTEGVIDDAITLVGSYAREKSFNGDEEGSIHLKRPFVAGSRPALLESIIPPTVATAILVLSDSNDPRFRSFVDYSSMSWYDRVSVVGKDLMRFLRSAFRLRYTEIEKLSSIVRRFTRLVFDLTGRSPKPGLPSFSSCCWPLDPLDYEFLDCGLDPLGVLIYTFSTGHEVRDKLEVVSGDVDLQFRYEGDVFEANSDDRLKLLEDLGFVEKEKVQEVMSQSQLESYWMSRLFSEVTIVPAVNRYTVSKDIPHYFMYSL